MRDDTRGAALAVLEVLGVVLATLFAAIVPVVLVSIVLALGTQAVTLRLAPHFAGESAERLGTAVAERFPGVAAQSEAEGGEELLVVTARGARVPAPEAVAEVARERGWEVRDAAVEAAPGGMVEPPASVVLVVQFVVFLTAGVLGRRVLCRADLPLRSYRLPELVGFGMLTAIVLLAGSIAIEQVLRLFGVPFAEQAWIIDLVEQGGAELLWIAPLVVLLAPIAEELLFRGYVFERLRQRAGLGLAYGLSAGIFAVVHMNPPGMLIYGFLGLVLAAAYHRTGSLLVPVLAHVVNNGLAFALLLAFGGG